MRSGAEKPSVTELGPFSYREVREKQNIVQVQETISYGSYIAYEFDREASCEECGHSLGDRRHPSRIAKARVMLKNS